jgi:hypothetical protein
MIFCMYFVLYGISVHFEVPSGLSKNIIPTPPSKSKNKKKKAFTPAHHGAGGGLLVPTHHGISCTPPLLLPPPRTGQEGGRGVEGPLGAAGGVRVERSFCRQDGVALVGLRFPSWKA